MSALLYSPGDFCYLIEATDALPGPAGSINYAFSNELCLQQEPVVWIPNAILIGGVNNTFQPVVSFADFANYRMEIHNRWGDVLFSTEDFATGGTAPTRTSLSRKARMGISSPSKTVGTLLRPAGIGARAQRRISWQIGLGGSLYFS